MRIIIMNAIGATWFATTVVGLAASVQVGEARPGLAELQIKADERDRFASQCMELKEQLAKLEAANTKPIMRGTPLSGATQGGHLYELEKRAEKAATLVHDLAAAEQSLVALSDALNVAKTENLAVTAARDEAEARVAVLQDVVDTLKKEASGLRQTVRRLLLGEFEYYEVKQGESLASIASNPMIYNDASRSNWLRQANEGRVKDLENLRTGEMLVIPRFPQNGSYEF